MSRGKFRTPSRARCRSPGRHSSRHAWSRRSISEVMQFAPRRTRDRRHRRRPSPSGLVEGTTDDGLVELEDVGPAVRERPHLIGRGERTGLQPWHRTILDCRRAARVRSISRAFGGAGTASLVYGRRFLTAGGPRPASHESERRQFKHWQCLASKARWTATSTGQARGPSASEPPLDDEVGLVGATGLGPTLSN